MTPIRALLIDISGTLLIGSSPIPGAAQALAKLRAAHIPFRLCSNTSDESSDATHQRLLAAGLDVRRAELWTSIGVLRTVLKKLAVKKPYMLLTQSALEEFSNELETEDKGAGASPLSDRTSSSSHDAVVVGLARDRLDYAHLNTAFRILIGEDRPRNALASQSPADPIKSTTDTQSQAHARPRPPLIALHKKRCLEDSDRALSLGPGPFVRALEDAARTSATVVGKPTRAFFEAVLYDLERDLDAVRDAGDHSDTSHHHHHQSDHGLSGSPPLLGSASHRYHWEGVAVIGDDVHADLGEGAVELGLWRVLVKTGKYRPGDESRSDALSPPDQVCASFVEFVETLLERRNMPTTS